MRHLLAILAATCLVVASADAAPVAPVVQPTFVLNGGGWGHGVGMSQWGAYGQALAGRSHEQILAAYYPGTRLGQTAPRTVRILIAAGVKSLRIGSTGAITVLDATGAALDLPAGELTLSPKLQLAQDGVPTQLASPLTVLAAPGTPLTVAGKAYRGRLTVTSDGTQLQAVNNVALELYLQGVVPGEVPKAWPAAALRAQAVAARTYAIATLVKGKAFDLYPDWRSQVYHGVTAESVATTRAVRETRGQILTYGGKPAQTFYFSSSGGRTRSAVDVYGQDVPYLVSVDDPWDAVAGNPNHRWQPATLTAKKLASLLKLGSPVVDAATTLGGDLRPVSVTFTTQAGRTRTVTARDLRTLLGLRSTSFRLGVLALAPAAPAIRGEPVTLEGRARDVDGPVLERLGPDGGWARARPVKPGPDGVFTAIVRPATTTTYRLVGGGVAGPTVTVVVNEAPA